MNRNRQLDFFQCHTSRLPETRISVALMALGNARPAQQEQVHHIDLPFKVHRNFSRHYDWGQDNQTHGGIKTSMSGHVEMLACERAMALAALAYFTLMLELMRK